MKKYKKNLISKMAQVCKVILRMLWVCVLFLTLAIFGSDQGHAFDLGAHIFSSDCYSMLCDWRTGYLFKNNLMVLPLMIMNVSLSNPLCVRLPGYDTDICNITDSVIKFKREDSPFVIHESFILKAWSSLRPDLTMRTLTFRVLDQRLIDFENLLREDTAMIEVIWPSYGHITNDRLFMRLSRSQNRLSQVKISVRGLQTYDVALRDDNILQTENAVEPGSWFLDTSLSNGSVFEGRVHNSFIEFVLSPKDIIKERVFRWETSFPNSAPLDSLSAWIGGTRAVSIPLLTSASASGSTSSPHYSLSPSLQDTVVSVDENKKINICVWASDTLDGQRTIWLNQILNLPSEEFEFSWVVFFENIASKDWNSTLLYQLAAKKKLNLDVSPFYGAVISAEELQIPPNDGDMSFSDYAKQYTGADVYSYCAHRMQKANYVLSKVTPLWVKVLFEKVTTMLISQKCDIVVFGNDRGSHCDVLITDASRSLHIPTVTELMNLFGSPLAVPDVVVSPSRYGLMHHSMHDTLYHRFEDPLIRLHEYPMSVVISPGVDVNKFDRHRYGDVSKRYDFPGCSRICVDNANGSNISDRIDNKNNSSSNSRSNNDGNNDDCCFVIGFMARIAPEKSPGLFVMAAAEYLQRNHQARYLMIGDGSLMESIKELTIRLGVYWAFEFVGWVSPDMLPWYLMSMSVVVNPSLRAWSETFCIANIEVMSMGIPLITFGVGGVGEYVLRSSHSTKDSLFDVTENAILVNEASPQAIAMALDCIWKNKTLGMELGQRGRDVVENYFNIKYQMSQYRSLYRYIYENHK